MHDVMPGTEELLQKEMTKGYIGFDPTADSLGVGNLVQIMTLMHFQKAGAQAHGFGWRCHGKGGRSERKE